MDSYFLGYNLPLPLLIIMLCLFQFGPVRAIKIDTSVFLTCLPQFFEYFLTFQPEAF